MEKLIIALQILLKYGNPDYPTHCEHDELTVHGIDPKIVSKEDLKQLSELGFFVTSDDDDVDAEELEDSGFAFKEDFDYWFCSYKYGSC